jgi:hypothetical protein
MKENHGGTPDKAVETARFYENFLDTQHERTIKLSRKPSMRSSGELRH